MTFPVLVVGDKRLWDVRFHCVHCGMRYWQVPEACDDPLGRAIREESQWHQQNVERYGSLFPVGIEPLFGSGTLRA